MSEVDQVVALCREDSETLSRIECLLGGILEELRLMREGSRIGNG